GVFCRGQPAGGLEGAVRKLVEAGQDCPARRVSAEQAEHLGRLFPQARQDPVARTFWLPAAERAAPAGKVFVLTAGTSDLPVAREAAVTAEALRCEVALVADGGVAGIHPLPRHQGPFRAPAAILVAA